MRVVIEDISSVKKRLHIEVPPEDVLQEIKNVYRKLSREAKIKGFRKGKIPKRILEMHFGEKVETDVTNKLISSTLTKAVQDNKMEPVLRPEIVSEPIKEGGIFRYTATFEVIPDVKIKGYKGITIDKKKVEVGKKEVEEKLRMLRERNVRWKDNEEEKPIEKGDLAIIDFEGFVGGKPLQGGNTKDFSFEVGSGTLLPSFEDQIIGMKIGEAKDVEVKYPENYRDKNLAGKEGIFKVYLRGIKEKILPEIDDDFAKDLQSKDLEELKKRIKEDLKKQKEIEEEKRWREEVLKKLVEMNPFDLPPSMVEEHLSGMVIDALNNLKKQGLSLNDPGVSMEGFKNQYYKRAEMEVRSNIILRALAEQEAIDVSKDDIDSKLVELASLYGEKIENLRRLAKDSRFLNSIKQQIKEDNIFALIESTTEEGEKT